MDRLRNYWDEGDLWRRFIVVVVVLLATWLLFRALHVVPNIGTNSRTATELITTVDTDRDSDCDRAPRDPEAQEHLAEHCADAYKAMER
jgi:hypothetical protein